MFLSSTPSLLFHDLVAFPNNWIGFSAPLMLAAPPRFLSGCKKT